MNTQNTLKSNLWLLPMLTGLLYFIFGIWFIKAPLNSFKTLTIVFGIIIFISGAFETIIAMNNKATLLDYRSYLWSGIISALLGIMLVFNPKAILLFVSLMVSLWFLFKGAMLIFNGLNQKKLNNPIWKRPLVAGIISILVAVLLIWHPEIIGFTIALWAALAFIILGVFRMYLGYKLKTSKSINIDSIE